MSHEHAMDGALGDSDVIDIGQVRPAPFAAAYRRKYENILFLHFRMPRELVRAWIPRRLELDLFDGSAWLGIVAATTRSFEQPGLFGVSHELSVRTYVRGEGIYLLDLDVDHARSLWTAQRQLGLRCHRSRMVELAEGRAFAFSSQRPAHDGQASASELTLTWTTSPTDELSLGDDLHGLDTFFSRRTKLCVHSHDLAIDSSPMRLSPARLNTFQSTVLENLGFPAPKDPPHVRFAAEQYVELAKLDR